MPLPAVEGLLRTLQDGPPDDQVDALLTLSSNLSSEAVGEVVMELVPKSEHLFTLLQSRVGSSQTDEQQGPQAEIQHAALRTLGFCLAQPLLVATLSDDTADHLLCMLLDVAHSSGDLNTSTRVLWVLSQQLLPPTFMEAKLSSLLSLLEKLLAPGEAHFVVENEALKVLSRLLQQVPRAMTQKSTSWLPLLLPMLAHSNAKVRARALSVLEAAMPLLTPGSSAELSASDSAAISVVVEAQLKGKLLKEMEKLFAAKNEVHVMRVWALCVTLLYSVLRKGGKLTNAVLHLAELGFRSSSSEVKSAAYSAWKSLIDNFTSEPELLSNGKRLRLLLQPLLVTTVRVEVLALAMLRTWWHLVGRLKEQVASSFEQVCVPLLQFVLGSPLNETTLTAASTPTGSLKPGLPVTLTPNFRLSLGTGSGSARVSSRAMQLRGCELIGHLLLGPDIAVLGLPLTLAPLASVPITAGSSFTRLAPTLIMATHNALSIAGSDVQSSLVLPVWHKLLSHVAAGIESAGNRKERHGTDNFALLLMSLQHLVRSENLPASLSMSLLEATVAGLPKKVLGSPAYHVASMDVMQGTSALFLIQILFHDSLLQLDSAEQRLESLLHTLVGCVLDGPASPLGFSAVVLGLLEQAAVGATLPCQRLCTIWELVVHPLTARIQQTKEVNQGDTLEHNFTALYKALLLPIQFIFPAASLRPASLTAVLHSWKQLYQAFSCCASLVCTAEANVWCEELCALALPHLHVDQLAHCHSLRATAHLVSVMLANFDFTALAQNRAGTDSSKGCLSPVCPRRVRKDSLGNLSSLTSLLARAIEAFGTAATAATVETAQTKLWATGAKLVDAAATLLRRLQASSEIRAAMTMMVPPIASLYAQSGRKGHRYSPLLMGKLPELWEGVAGLLEGPSAGPHDDSLLQLLSPLLCHTLPHRTPAVRSRAAQFWDATFGRTKAPLNYPEQLRLVMQRQRTPLALPGVELTDEEARTAPFLDDSNDDDNDAVADKGDSNCFAVKQEATVQDGRHPTGTSVKKAQAIHKESQPTIPTPVTPTHNKTAIATWASPCQHVEKATTPKASSLRSPRTVRTRQFVQLEEESSQDFVFIPPPATAASRSRVLTEHQKEVLRTKRVDIPTMYNTLDASQDSTVFSQLSGTQDSESSGSSALSPLTHKTPIFAGQMNADEMAVKRVVETEAIAKIESTGTTLDENNRTALVSSGHLNGSADNAKEVVQTTTCGKDEIINSASSKEIEVSSSCVDDKAQAPQSGNDAPECDAQNREAEPELLGCNGSTDRDGANLDLDGKAMGLAGDTEGASEENVAVGPANSSNESIEMVAGTPPRHTPGERTLPTLGSQSKKMFQELAVDLEMEEQQQEQEDASRELPVKPVAQPRTRRSKSRENAAREGLSSGSDGKLAAERNVMVDSQEELPPEGALQPRRGRRQCRIKSSDHAAPVVTPRSKLVMESDIPQPTPGTDGRAANQRRASQKGQMLSASKSRRKLLSCEPGMYMGDSEVEVTKAESSSDKHRLGSLSDSASFQEHGSYKGLMADSSLKGNANFGVAVADAAIPGCSNDLNTPRSKAIRGRQLKLSQISLLSTNNSTPSPTAEQSPVSSLVVSQPATTSPVVAQLPVAAPVEQFPMISSKMVETSKYFSAVAKPSTPTMTESPTISSAVEESSSPPQIVALTLLKAFKSDEQSSSQARDGSSSSNVGDDLTETRDTAAVAAEEEINGTSGESTVFSPQASPSRPTSSDSRIHASGEPKKRRVNLVSIPGGQANSGWANGSVRISVRDVVRTPTNGERALALPAFERSEQSAGVTRDNGAAGILDRENTAFDTNPQPTETSASAETSVLCLELVLSGSSHLEPKLGLSNLLRRSKRKRKSWGCGRYSWENVYMKRRRSMPEASAPATGGAAVSDKDDCELEGKPCPRLCGDAITESDSPLQPLKTPLEKLSQRTVKGGRGRGKGRKLLKNVEDEVEEGTAEEVGEEEYNVSDPVGPEESPRLNETKNTIECAAQEQLVIDLNDIITTDFKAKEHDPETEFVSAGDNDVKTSHVVDREQPGNVMLPPSPSLLVSRGSDCAASTSLSCGADPGRIDTITTASHAVPTKGGFEEEEFGVVSSGMSKEIASPILTAQENPAEESNPKGQEVCPGEDGSELEIINSSGASPAEPLVSAVCEEVMVTVTEAVAGGEQKVPGEENKRNMGDSKMEEGQQEEEEEKKKDMAAQTTEAPASPGCSTLMRLNGDIAQRAGSPPPVAPRGTWSPAASPSPSILKKAAGRKSEAEQLPSDSPPNKARRVSFANPIRHETLADDIDRRSPSRSQSRTITQHLLTPTRISPMSRRPLSRRALGNTPPKKRLQEQLCTMLPQPLEVVPVQSVGPIFPALIGCKTPVEAVLHQLTPAIWARGLGHLVRARSISTVGDLAALNSADLHSLPIRSPKFHTLHRVLKIFHEQKGPGATEQEMALVLPPDDQVDCKALVNGLSEEASRAEAPGAPVSAGGTGFLTAVSALTHHNPSEELRVTPLPLLLQAHGELLSALVHVAQAMARR
ncbi:telomere-associated protein RIF1 isoform X1 [Petromyzon marinus]|uniref:telomere-associated protein RIF1 isoform X1 n=1 Tax=Petromyzon marinus TaxID=7757 RepID=UPI003F701B48